MGVVRIESLPDSGNSYRFDGSAYDAPVSFFLLLTKRGEGPGLHRHPYAETFIVPASVGPYAITPTEAAGGTECATIKAFVRP